MIHQKSILVFFFSLLKVIQLDLPRKAIAFFLYKSKLTRKAYILIYLGMSRAKALLWYSLLCNNITGYLD